MRPASPKTKELATRIMMAPNITRANRAIVVGSGALSVIDVLKFLGVQDIVAVDLTTEYLDVVTTAHGAASSLGNEPGVRVWRGDFCELPPYMGPADVVVFTDEPFGTEQSPRDALVKASLLTLPGGCVIINSDMDSRRWQPKWPPTREALAKLVSDLPMEVHSEQEVANAYCGILQVPFNYRLKTPFALGGEVVHGFGRGSREMGTPTANIDTAPLSKALAGVPAGVYFGWAKLTPPKGWPAADAAVHKMVLNVGSRPTVNTGGEAPSVECHILHDFAGGPEFYGSQLKMVAVSFLRPEIRFDDVESLVARIRADIAIAKSELDTPALRALATVLAD